MKNLTNKKAFKTISLMLVIIFITNVFMPIYSYADEDEDWGGKLFKPIAKLIAGVGDLIIKTLQEIFYADFDIKEPDGTFDIKYGPAAIFSGVIPGLDANFINPGKKLVYSQSEAIGTTMISNILSKEGKEEERINYVHRIGYVGTQLKTKKGALKDLKKTYEYETSEDVISQVVSVNAVDNINKSNSTATSTQKIENIEAAWMKQTGDSVKLYIVLNVTRTITSGYSQQEVYKDLVLYTYDASVGELNNELQNVGNIEYTNNESLRQSTAEVLRPTIAKWYKALRLIALVGLLSVLVYVGIRIIISSTGQEKAKYKKMIMDWIAAICILFILHYIMAFTMTIVENILNIFTKNGNIIEGQKISDQVITDPGIDVLMNSVRSKINTSGQFSSVFGLLIIYIVLVIYTVVFTIHYLKRLVYLAFFTMIAPLIALTYPLDKIKDGQAQAFTMWLREYVFNALIPVIHILLYSIFVGSAIDFAEQNPIYAIVCIGFLIPAEKFIRKMFGFDKATTSSQLGAAASGAMVMNAVNKISHAAGNGGAGGKVGKPGKAGLAGGSGSGDGSPTRISDRPDGGSPLTDPADTKIPELTGGTNSSLGGDVTGTTKKPRRTIKGIGKGMSNIRKQYFNAANARKGVKALGRGARKAAIGALGAGALGTIGLAAGVASGDLGKAVQYAAGGAAGGFIGANKVGDKLTTLEKKNRDIFNEGSLGSTEFKTRETIKELQQDNDFNQLCKELGINKGNDRKRLIREFSNNGITDAESIKKAVFAGSSSDMVKNNGQQGINTMIDAAKIRQQATKQGMNRKDVKELLNSRGITGPNEEEALNLIYSM